MSRRVSEPFEDVTVYLVLNDHGQVGIAYDETDPAEADRETIIRNFLSNTAAIATGLGAGWDNRPPAMPARAASRRRWQDFHGWSARKPMTDHAPDPYDRRPRRSALFGGRMPRPRISTEMRPSMPARKRWPCLNAADLS
jgi:hypothetical protein